MANVESLIVELDAKIDGYVDGMNKAKQKNDAFGGASQKMGKIVGKSTDTIKKAGVAILAAQAAMTGAAIASARYGKEIQNAATLTKVSVEEMQALGAATNTVGIDMEKLSDISKDTSEKIGDFMNTGGGGFQDFADALSLSEEQAMATAKAFEGMAAPDVLQEMVNQMEEGGVSAEQMSHALEGMASDTTSLIPLLTNGGEAMKKLKDDFTETSVVLSNTDISKLTEMAGNFTALGDTFQGTMGKFSVEYADQFNSIIETTQAGLKIVGDEFASGSFTDRLNSFYEAFTASWAVAMGDNISVFDDFSGDATEVITSLAEAWLDFALTLPINFKIAGLHVKEIFADILDSIQVSLAEANMLVQEALDFVGAGDVEGAQAALDAITAQTDARDAAHETELEQLRASKEAILDKFRAEQEAATTKREQYAADSGERMALAEAEEKAERKRLKGKVKGDKEETVSGASKAKGIAKAKQEMTKNAMVLNEQLFNNNKAIGAGIIVAETAQNVVTSVKNSGGVPWGLPAGAAAAAMGVAQLSALKGASKGGGSISSSGGGGGGANIQNPPLQDFEAETSGLELTDSTAGGAQTMRIEFINSTGDDIINSIADGLNTAQREGRTS